MIGQGEPQASASRGSQAWKVRNTIRVGEGGEEAGESEAVGRYWSG